jgi:hypothetical protein
MERLALRPTPRPASAPIPGSVPATVADPAARAVHSATFVASVRPNFYSPTEFSPITIFVMSKNQKDTVTRCGATVTLNNTYWQAPTTLSTESTCSLNVKMDPTLPEQRRNPICQVRWVYYIISVIPRAEPKPTQRTWLLYRKRIDEILMCVYIIDWISKLSPSPDPILRPFALRTTSGWAGLPIKCRLFAAKMSASTVSWFRCYHHVYQVILNDVQFDSSVLDCPVVDCWCPIDIHAGHWLGTGS